MQTVCRSSQECRNANTTNGRGYQGGKGRRAQIRVYVLNFMDEESSQPEE
jgi:hypothetical protein